MKLTLGALYISRYQCCLLKDNTLHRCIVNPPRVHPITVPPVGVPPPNGPLRRSYDNYHDMYRHKGRLITVGSVGQLR